MNHQAVTTVQTSTDVRTVTTRRSARLRRLVAGPLVALAGVAVLPAAASAQTPPPVPNEINGAWVATPGATAPLPPMAGTAQARARCTATTPGWRVRILSHRYNWTRTSDRETYRNTLPRPASFQISQSTAKTVSATMTAGVETAVKAPLIAEAKVKVEGSVSGSYTVQRGVTYTVPVPAKTNVWAAIGVERVQVQARAYRLDRCGNVVERIDSFGAWLPYGKGLKNGTF